MNNAPNDTRCTQHTSPSEIYDEKTSRESELIEIDCLAHESQKVIAPDDKPMREQHLLIQENVAFPTGKRIAFWDRNHCRLGVDNSRENGANLVYGMVASAKKSSHSAIIIERHFHVDKPYPAGVQESPFWFDGCHTTGKVTTPGKKEAPHGQTGFAHSQSRGEVAV